MDSFFGKSNSLLTSFENTILSTFSSSKIVIESLQINSYFDSRRKLHTTNSVILRVKNEKLQETKNSIEEVTHSVHATYDNNENNNNNHNDNNKHDNNNENDNNSNINKYVDNNSMQNILELADSSFPRTTISYTIEFVVESTDYDNIDIYQKKIFQIIQNSTINNEFVNDFNTLVNTIAINNKYGFHKIISTSVKNLGFNSEILKSFAPTFLPTVAPTFISNISNKSTFLSSFFKKLPSYDNKWLSLGVLIICFISLISIIKYIRNKRGIRKYEPSSVDNNYNNDKLKGSHTEDYR